MVMRMGRSQHLKSRSGRQMSRSATSTWQARKMGIDTAIYKTVTSASGGLHRRRPARSRALGHRIRGADDSISSCRSVPAAGLGGSVSLAGSVVGRHS